MVDLTTVLMQLLNFSILRSSYNFQQQMAGPFQYELKYGLILMKIKIQKIFFIYIYWFLPIKFYYEYETVLILILFQKGHI